REALAYRHVPPSLVPGKPLEIALTFDRPVDSVGLYYRHVNQAERFKSTLIQGRDGRYQATIPGSYTDSPYPLQYYFQVRTAKGTQICPGFSKGLTNQPYVVIRSAAPGSRDSGSLEKAMRSSSRQQTGLCRLSLLISVNRNSDEADGRLNLQASSDESFLWRPNMSSPLMPSLVDQPFLQGVEMNFVITAPKARDVSLESRFVEPSKHLIKLLAQNESNHRHRQLAELDRLPKDTAENPGCFRISQLASGNLNFCS